MLAITLMVSGCTTAGQNPASGDDEPKRPKSSRPAEPPTNDPAQAAPQTPAPDTEPDTINVYFANEQATQMLKEVREVESGVNKPQRVIEELIKGPAAPTHGRTIPEGTRLLGITVQDGVASVNFSSEFVTNHGGGTAGELMTVYSVVNSLTDLFQVNQVRFLVNGQPLETLNALDLTQPVDRDSGLIGSE